FNDALIGNTTGDIKVGSYSARLRTGSIYTSDAVSNVSSIDFSIAKYGTDGNSTVYAYVSTNGIDWIDITDAVPFNMISVNTTYLVDYHISLNDSQNYIAAGLDTSDSLFFKLEKSGTTRVNIDQISFNTIYSGASNLISYNNDGTTTQVLVKSNVAMSAPEDPVKIGYTFEGWYIDPSYVTLYDFEAPVTSNFILFAKFTIKTNTITFDSNGGSAVTAITEEFETDVFAPVDPTRVGYTFDGWFSDAGLTTPYVFTTMPASSITLYAGWTIETYTISYELYDGINDAENPASYTVATPTITLAAPTKAGYTFDGWYDTAEFDNLIITTIDLGTTGNLTLYAKFTEIVGTSYTVTFDSNEGSAVTEQTVPENDYAIEPTDPTKSGYTFAGWFTDDVTFANSFSFGTAIVADITLYAKWDAISYGTDLFISEYIEGAPGNRKAIEIFNPTASPIVLNGVYTLAVNANANTTWSTTIVLSGTIASLDVFVVYYDDSSLNDKLGIFGDFESSTLNFNGDDAIGLFKNTVLLDIFGVFGEDPGTGWTIDSVSNATVDRVIIRKSTIISPRNIWDTTEWSIVSPYVDGSVTTLGTHT
ncbi:MAG: hypothetical protein CVV58_06915, partial [Tenericutes bacterium HGW-Tenericutes-3]